MGGGLPPGPMPTGMPGPIPGPGPGGPMPPIPPGSGMPPEPEPDGDELAGGVEPPSPEPDMPPAGAGGGSQMFTDSQVSYHGPQEICGTCDYFQPPNECVVVQGPKDESGWCTLHSARAGGAGGGGLVIPPGMGEGE